MLFRVVTHKNKIKIKRVISLGGSVYSTEKLKALLGLNKSSTIVNSI